MAEPGFPTSDGNGRYGGGEAGDEDRFHFPMVDCARWDEAHVGRYDTSPLHAGGSAKVEAADNSTMAGGRGKLMGASLPDDRGGFG
jgi:hypothetical protein